MTVVESFTTLFAREIFAFIVASFMSLQLGRKTESLFTAPTFVIQISRMKLGVSAQVLPTFEAAGADSACMRFVDAMRYFVVLELTWRTVCFGAKLADKRFASSMVDSGVSYKLPRAFAQLRAHGTPETTVITMHPVNMSGKVPCCLETLRANFALV